MTSKAVTRSFRRCKSVLGSKCMMMEDESIPKGLVVFDFR